MRFFHAILHMFTLFLVIYFFFNDTATTEIYTLSLHDALPIFHARPRPRRRPAPALRLLGAHHRLLLPADRRLRTAAGGRSEEHTSELQSRQYLVCRLLLEKKK